MRMVSPTTTLTNRVHGPGKRWGVGTWPSDTELTRQKHHLQVISQFVATHSNFSIIYLLFDFYWRTLRRSDHKMVDWAV